MQLDDSFFLHTLLDLDSDLILRFSGILTVLLILSSWVYLIASAEPGSLAVFSGKNLRSASDFFAKLLGEGIEQPAYLEIEAWNRALQLSLDTLKMSLLAIGFSGGGMLLTVLLGARTTADGTLTLSDGPAGTIAFLSIRWSYVLARGIPELFWAMFLLFVFTPGILPGALALAVHNYGILGKLCSEIIEDMDIRPIRSLRSSGAGLGQTLFYGVLPALTPQFLTYSLYRWEEIIRTTIVVGFVSAGGLGREFKLSMNWFHYTEVTLYLISYFLLVILVDLLSGGLRAISKMD
jgi:phosphonate transport system permease protein